MAAVVAADGTATATIARTDTTAVAAAAVAVGRGGGGGGGGRRRSYGQQTDRQDRPDGDFHENGEPLPLVAGSGVLEMHPNGYGFLRNPATNFTRERTDPFVPGTMIEKFGLREGVLINGMVQHHRRGQGPRLQGNPRRRRHAARRLPQRQVVRRAHADQPRRVAAAGNRPARRSPRA